MFLTTRILRGKSFDTKKFYVNITRMLQKNAFGRSLTQTRRTRYSKNMNTVVFLASNLILLISKSLSKQGSTHKNPCYN